MVKSTIRIGAVAVLALTGMTIAPAHAATVWHFTTTGWTSPTAGLGTGSCALSSNTACLGTQRTWQGSTAGSGAVTVTGWSDTAGSAAAPVIESAYVAVYSGGLGVANAGVFRYEPDVDPNEGTPRAPIAPEHSIDNQGSSTRGVYDSVLLSFDETVTLTGLNIGWTQTDSDISVLAWVGSSAPTLAGARYNSLVTATGDGWRLVGQYSNVPVDTNPYNGPSRLINGAANVDDSTNSAVYSSRYWLVGAYNPVFDSTNWTSGNDYVKLLSVTGVVPRTPPQTVPEPGSLALAGSVIGAVVVVRRLRKKTKA